MSIAVSRIDSGRSTSWLRVLSMRIVAQLDHGQRTRSSIARNTTHIKARHVEYVYVIAKFPKFKSKPVLEIGS
jgi:hypothetical protein